MPRSIVRAGVRSAIQTTIYMDAPRKRMEARDVYDHLRSLDEGWVDWDDTTDGFEAGDPGAAVEGIAVGWMSYEAALERAAELGCNLFVTHEPTFYNTGAAPNPDDERDAVAERIATKRAFVEERDLTVLRCHDVWDRYPGIGVPDSWGRHLGLAEEGERAVEDGYYRAYDLPETTARDVAEAVASSAASAGESAVELVGPANAAVSRVATGTGAITSLPRMIDEYDPNMLVCSDDGFTHWRDGAIAIDAGLPVAVVNHATSELAGVRRLADHLEEAFPDVPVHHVEQSCTYELVTGG